MPMDRKPPIVVSPRRLRSRQLPPNLPKPTAKTATKTLLRHSIACETLFRPDQQLSSEFKFLPDRSTDDFTAAADVAGGSCDGDSSPLPPPLFERGRFYEVYSARRNERLKRKMLEVTEETVALYPEVAVELSKRRSLKKWETPRKSLPANFSVSRVSRLQSSEVRSIKKTKKIPALGISAMTPANSVRKILTRSALRKMT
ncbi:hypothetical protein AXF42_Ash009788 [Apostasia shenzhenica]|uniref:Uncharacterized protein n=1 Tax=Apostasia shenzhenica TaxID=1088818 RepID=A0A2I0AX33_9ASPA|nr:hypothetical protein AXF42_Ash009788 [Apostasia shenzhenica]